MTNEKAPVHAVFWLISVVALIWNGLGVLNFFMQMNPEVLAAMPESHRVIVETRPVWATVGVILAVFGGTLGCLLLLLRRSVAMWFMLISLVGVILQLIPNLGMIGSSIDPTPFEIVMMIVMPPVVAALLLWFATFSVRKGWIR